MNVEPTCRYCKRKLTDLRQGRGQIYIANCNACDSEQSFYETGQTREWSFMVGDTYCIHYWPESKALKIIEYKNNRPSKYVLEITLDKHPDHMTPQNMTEERVKTLIVFS